MSRVVTLLPGATEMVAALGAGDQLVGISHECDYPPWIGRLPRITTTPIDVSRPSAEIDADVRRLLDAGHPAITVDADALQALRPDLIVTQSLCEVCAVSAGTVHRVATALAGGPEVVVLDGGTLEGIYRDISTLGVRLGLLDEAEEMVAGMRYQLRRLTQYSGLGPAPKVLCIEWLDPLYLAGHWVPDLVAAAGGRDGGAAPGDPSRRRDWTDLPALLPDLVVVMLCGFGLERAWHEVERFTQDEATAHRFPLDLGCPIWVLDGNAYTSRPGPRVVEGARRIRAALAGEPAEGLLRFR